MDKSVIRSTRLPQFQEEVRGTTSDGGPNVQVDFDNLQMDPGERKKISEYDPTIQDEVRKKYIQIGPIQPKKHDFPYKTIGGKPRSFNATWFDNHENGLEYSKKKDALLDKNLKYEKNSIRNVFSEFSEQDKKDYKIRLEASVICAKYLLSMGLPFRGHNESEESTNRGNYIELLKVASVFSTDIRKVILRNPGNLQLTSPGIQKDINNAASLEALKAIFEELRDDLFTILVDESGDFSYKEQMAIVLRFVNKKGIVVERFVGIVHVTDTSALSLKSAIDELFDEYKLSLSSIRGQGYDGASNMRGEYSGLKTLIQKDNSSAYYIHCFAHQLGLNQELWIKRPCDTRWGSHYRSLLNLRESFLDVIDVLEFIYNDISNSSHKKNARGLMAYLRSFDFVFILHLMVDVLESRMSYHRLYKRRNKRYRFDEVNTELIRCLSCLRPKDGFCAFDSSMLEKMASFYPYDFDAVQVRHLTSELKNYILDVRWLKGLEDLARAMVETRKNIIYPHVYLLSKLSLILPVATATVERAFSAMKYIKKKLRNRMCDRYLNDCLVTYIERDIFESISIESIMYRFQNTKSRKGHYV
ncbi:hypothetical protein RND81_09G028800 [Saponaria officinalis]|uniref:Zinc finger MYM-type protein 1-like n=1 Tax=Saponaria officinalis TaxID=3572 RepID=A0AAW1IG57_SAPOF